MAGEVVSDKPEKVYLVSESQLSRLVLNTRIKTISWDESEDWPRVEFEKSMAECRKIEVRQEIFPGFLPAYEMWKRPKAFESKKEQSDEGEG